MARIDGVSPNDASLFTRFAYFMTKRKLGRVITPIKINGHHPRILRAMAHMEMGQDAARTVEPRLKALVQIKVAMIIGCHF